MRRLLPLFLVLLICSMGMNAWAQVSLSPGLYQLGEQATCRINPLPDGSWQFYLWQGAEVKGPTDGFAILARLVPNTSGQRLSGTWQALPGSCCPGMGRAEVVIVSPTSFQFSGFSAAPNSTDWIALPEHDFKWVAANNRHDPGQLLAGDWRMSLWYTGLLPNNQPTDLDGGQLRVRRDGQALNGQFTAWPNPLKITPDKEGFFLVQYQDLRAGFRLEAQIGPKAGGLNYEGQFTSSLGSGRISLVRAGLPANPAGQAKAVLGDISGTYVDPRTGNDFFKIMGSKEGFEFESYGGSYEQPRYLSRGSARPDGKGQYRGKARDAKGYCCGNQGRLLFREVGPDALEISSFWWPQGQPDPGNLVSKPYQITRVKQRSGTKTKTDDGQGWPLVRKPMAKLLSPSQGAVRVRFIYDPPEKLGESTLFSQVGYLSGLEMLIDRQGRLKARINSSQELVPLTSENLVTPNVPHDAWLIYKSNDYAALMLDGIEQARVSLGDVRVSLSPYLIGGSRWKDRNFSGAIELVELWRDPPQINEPKNPDLSIKPPAPIASQLAGKAVKPQAEPEVELVCFWNPASLTRAYAVGNLGAEMLMSQGFKPLGPVGRLLVNPGPDRTPLYAHRHVKSGHYLLTGQEQPPKDYQRDGLLGYVLNKAGADAVQLVMLMANLPDTMRGGNVRDYYYTASQENQAAAQDSGYGKPRPVGYVLPVKEPEFTPPVLYTWSGSWRGEGWGKFYLVQKGNTLDMFWYYGPFDGPHYFGRYALSADGRKAEGYAVGRPGPKATYYRQNLVFDSSNKAGPRIRIESARLAAPLDDGRLMTFSSPKLFKPLLYKTGQKVPVNAATALAQMLGSGAFQPKDLYTRAVAKAKSENRLVER
jgi:hypothetical protein